MENLKGFRARFILFLRRYTILAILVGMLIVCSLISPRFFSLGNFHNILTQAAPMGVICVGATFLMISGYRDLSVGMVMGLSAALTMGLQPLLGIFSIFAGMLAGVLVGLINGLLVSYGGMHTFVVTMATMQGVRSLTYIYTQEKSIVGIIPEFASFGAGDFLGKTDDGQFLGNADAEVSAFADKTLRGKVVGNNHGAWPVVQGTESGGQILAGFHRKIALQYIRWIDFQAIVRHCLLKAGKTLRAGRGVLLPQNKADF